MTILVSPPPICTVRCGGNMVTAGYAPSVYTCTLPHSWPDEAMPTNCLYYGDNLRWLRNLDHFPSNQVDLIYLDPPFNSKADYNIIFNLGAKLGGGKSPAQIKAFGDTWQWERAITGQQGELSPIDLLRESPDCGPRLVRFINMVAEDNKSMAAYLTMMAPRLVELRRVLKPTGSIYLHCDATASPYLRVLMDFIFGSNRFRNEITWRRTSLHSDAKRYPRVVDRILYYTKGPQFTWNRPTHQTEKHNTDPHYKYQEPDGRRYRLHDLNPPGGRGPTYEFRGFTRPWRFTKENMLALESQGLIVTVPGNIPQIKRYFSPDVPVSDVWDDPDVRPMNSQADERLPYPTQKPEGLLRRIIEASSNPGDLVLDPFCGCGTTVVVAEKEKRRWVGIDVTSLAIERVKDRLVGRFPSTYTDIEKQVSVYGDPFDEPSARALWERDPKEFEAWVVTRLGAAANERRGADKGVDGIRNFPRADGTPGTVLIQVKGGKNLHRDFVSKLRGDMERINAEMGLLVTLEEPTAPMREEAASSGSYLWERDGVRYPKIQIVTVKEAMLDKMLRGRLPLLWRLWKEATALNELARPQRLEI